MAIYYYRRCVKTCRENCGDIYRFFAAQGDILSSVRIERLAGVIIIYIGALSESITEKLNYLIISTGYKRYCCEVSTRW